MTEQGYNGWKNYETWCVGLWINNDQGWQEMVLDALREYVAQDLNEQPAGRLHAYRAGRIIRDNVEEMVGYMFSPETGEMPASLASDLVNAALSEVDWDELGASFLTDLSEQD